MLSVAKSISTLALTCVLAACAPIERQETLEQPLGTTLNAGVGDVVLRLERTRNLENVYGGSDIFGRKTNEGYSEVKYLGMRDPDTAVFMRRDVTILTNETTLSRSGGMYVPNTTTTTGAIGRVPVSGTSTTTGGGTFVPAPQADTRVLPPDVFEVVVDMKTDKKFVVGGKTVTIIEATPSRVSFQIN